ncbi:murein transglycosylase A [Pigmentiphaga sp. D-2]|uniref:murein transglycosylase A n=1 Tax=Pigmentiphaga sp. D-2 TaxID=1002116 RepID=UPI001048A49C|nr:MltA domain-containing protein [Pigmentiphaga sp. D-2]
MTPETSHVRVAPPRGLTMTAAAGAGLLALAACTAPATRQPPPAVPTAAATASTPPMPPAPSPAGAARPAAAAAPLATDGGAPAQPQPEGLGTPFSTRYARFEPVPFSALPGWSADSARESLSAFRQSCLALGKKPVWDELCAAAGRIAATDDGGIRAFFEQRFHAYSMQNPDQSDEGVITGYYEPLLEGSRTRSSRYPYPVHGVPADLLFLDAQVAAAGKRQWLRLDDRRLTPAAPGSPGARQYDVDMGGLTPGIRDKRYRVRVEGNRIVPYWSRQDIERRALDAQVLAWVNDAYALYSLQIQGSGKIRLASGETLRVAYGEQNGHPFLPQASSADTATVGAAIKTRGLALGGGSAAATSSALQPVASPRAAPAIQRDPDVARIIAALQGRGNGTPARPAAPSPAAAMPVATPSAAASPASRPAAPDPDVAAIIAALGGKAPARPVASPAPATPADASPAAPAAIGGAGQATGIPDPSYVFFRLIPDGPQGPLGALGVPLTAGRSIAVDPRTTPLGYPVFVSTGDPSPAAGTVNRLMFAQDTGGAIRGTVRADYFWGFGPTAGDRAARMKETGRMWLLLPRDLQTAAMTAAVRTRSLGGPAVLAECVVPDPDNCVEQ